MIRYNTKRYWGYSTDTKPVNAQIGDRFLEIDTFLEYFFDDYNQWILIGKTDVFVTGGTYNNGTATFTNNTGGTFNVLGFPTATGGTTNYYGSFSDTTNQTVSGANTSTVWKYNTTEISNGIFVQDQTKITVSHDGIYEIGYSGQIEKTQGGASTDVTIWASINGTPIDRSSSTITLVSNSAYQLPFVSYILNLNAGDYVEFYFSAPSQYVRLTTLSGLTSPTRPISPSVIISAKAIGNAVLSNTGDTYVTGFTLTNNTLELTQNRLGTYSGFSVNLPYVSNTGGTINGNLNVTGSLSASTFYGYGGNLTGISRGGGGGAGGQLYYFNISKSQSPYYEFSTSATSSPELTISATTNPLSTAQVAGFMTPVGLPNITSIPAGIISFYLHTYDGNANHNYNIYCQLFKRTTGGTETLLFTSEPVAVVGNTVAMVITDGYFSGATLNTTDRLVVKILADNITNQTRTIYFVSEGSQHYSFCLSTIPTFFDTYTTGATKSGTIATFTNNSGGTFTLTGLTDTFVTGATYSNNSFTYRNNTGGTFNVLFNTVTGLTVNGNLTVTGTTTSSIISATTYQNLPTDVRVTGGTYSGSTIIFTNNTGGTFSVTGITTSSAFTGGTVTGATSFTNGLTANTISATTYQNLPTDIRVTGATYSNNTFTYTNNTGGTFNVLFNTVTGLTVNGNLTVTGTTTSTTISATTYQNLPATPFLPLSGGTVSGATTFTNGLTANTISASTFTSSTETIIGRIPTNETGSVSAGTGPVSVYIQGDYVYVINTNSSTLQIFDISNPLSPVLIGTVSTGSTPLRVYVQGSYAYVTNFNSNTLQIFDVSNPSSPVSVGTVSTGLNPSALYVQGRYVYVLNSASNTLQIFDVSNPSSPVLVGSVSTGTNPQNVYVQGRYAYIINSNSNTLQIFDVLNPSFPVSVGTVSTGTNPQSLFVQGKYVYVTNIGSSTLQIFDVSNPSSPVSVATTSTGFNPRGVYLQGRYVYFVNLLSNTFQIIDVSNPSSPVSVGTVTTGTNPSALYVQGRYVYVVNQTSNTLQIFDVGGSYIQQLEAGGILTNTLESVGNATIGNDLTVVGGLNVSQSTNILGNLSATNMRVVSGLTANTISATTYQNLPTDIRVTGATYSNNTFTYTNNTGGTFSVLFNTVTGLTVNGNLTVTGTTTSSSVSATTITATTITSPSISSYGLIVATSYGYQNIF